MDSFLRPRSGAHLDQVDSRLYPRSSGHSVSSHRWVVQGLPHHREAPRPNRVFTPQAKKVAAARQVADRKGPFMPARLGGGPDRLHLPAQHVVEAQGHLLSPLLRHGVADRDPLPGRVREDLEL